LGQDVVFDSQGHAFEVPNLPDELFIPKMDGTYMDFFKSGFPKKREVDFSIYPEPPPNLPRDFWEQMADWDLIKPPSLAPRF